MGSSTSVLQRSETVLLVIDIQERLAAAMPNRVTVVERTSFLAQIAQVVGVPIIVTRQYPRGLGGLDSSLAQALRETEPVDKVTFDCFCEPSFASALASVDARQALITGMETHICVAQTALAALREGYDVHVCADATCSRDETFHRLALSRLAHAGAVVTCSESAAYELVGRAGTDEFKALLAAVKG